MRVRHAVLPTPSVSLRLNQALSCQQIMRETPQIPLYVFNSLRTLSFSVSRKSCVCHSYENSRVCTNNSQSGTPYELAPSKAEGLLVYPEPNVRGGTVLKFFLFTPLRTLLHSRKTQLIYSQAIPHSLRKTPGRGGDFSPHPNGDVDPEKRRAY